MDTTPAKPSPPKPISRRAASVAARLPALTPARRLARRMLRTLARFLVWLLARLEVHGLENIPAKGAALVVANHLGDADVVVGLAVAPRLADVVAKIELYDFPLLGWLLQVYGVIWVQRGQPDRKALRAVLQGLENGRMVAIAPEGRESLSGALEEGTHGAAFLALRSQAPLLPVTITGTEKFYSNLKRLRRTPITVTIGQPFQLPPLEGARHAELEQATRFIMQALARQLPPEYRGVYS